MIPVERLRAIVDQQADDDALWALGLDGRLPISEAYLQQELRRLHWAVEAIPLGSVILSAEEVETVRAALMDARPLHVPLSLGWRENKKALAVLGEPT